MPASQHVTGPELLSGAQLRVRVDISELERERVGRHWTKRRLAAAMGVSAPTLYDVYRRESTSATTAEKLLAAFDLKPGSPRAERLLSVIEEQSA